MIRDRDALPGILTAFVRTANIESLHSIVPDRQKALRPTKEGLFNRLSEFSDTDLEEAFQYCLSKGAIRQYRADGQEVLE
jgi:hypothetical protein